MGKVTVIGSANMDLVATVPHLPHRGETIAANRFLTVFGGKGANEAVAAARLGSQVSLVAMLGQDPFGQDYLEHLRREKIDVRFVVSVAESPTGCALIAVDETQGDKTIIIYPGANAALSPAHVQAANSLNAESDIVLVQNEIPRETVLAVIQAANEANVPVILNLSPIAGLVDFGNLQINYLLVNEVEAEALTGIVLADQQSFHEAANRLHAMNAETIIITRGADPTFVSSGNKSFQVPTQKVNPVDTVGAGDTFAGGIATALSEGAALENAVLFANAAAALSTLQVGAQTSMPFRAEAGSGILQ